MRTRKAKGPRKALVTLTETELIDAGFAFLESRGYKLGKMCYLKVPARHEERRDSRGRKIPRRKVELVVEVEQFP